MPRTLRRGMRGDDVTELQLLLNHQLPNSPRLKPDGDFGGLTDQAVRNFQRGRQLEVDGIVGQASWQALLNQQQSAAPPVNVEGNPRWLQVARGEIGVRETRGNEHNQRILQYHASTSLRATSDETPWCASFVNWCLIEAGVAGTNSAAAASFARWGIPTYSRPGAVCVIHNPGAANTSLSRSGNHVGFLISENSTHYSLLGGNQSDSVKVSDFRKSSWQLKGMRWAT